MFIVTFQYLYSFLGKIGKLDCLEHECWCVSKGGNTCSYPDPESGICDPDECSDRNECPGYGYWCDENSGIIFFY